MADEFVHLESEMNRGYLQVLILVLLERSMYGYGMLRDLEERGYVVEENTLYPLLRRLEKMALITSEWDVSHTRPKKFYAVTDSGRSVRQRLLDIRSRQNGVLRKIMEEREHV